MALAIGFANKYYTLWSVETVENYITYPNGSYGLASVTCNRFYFKNLSMDKEEALRKAKLEGVKNLEVDTELKGKTRSWSTEKRIAYDYKDYEFRGGKYDTLDIRECDDLDYLLWWKNDRDYGKEHVIKRITELDDNYTIYKKELYTLDEVRIAGLKNKIESGKILMTAVSNFSNEAANAYRLRLKIANPKGKSEKEWNHKVEESWTFGTFYVSLIGFELAHKSFRGNNYATLKGERSFKGTNLYLKKDKSLDSDYYGADLNIVLT